MEKSRPLEACHPSTWTLESKVKWSQLLPVHGWTDPGIRLLGRRALCWMFSLGFPTQGSVIPGHHSRFSGSLDYTKPGAVKSVIFTGYIGAAGLYHYFFGFGLMVFMLLKLNKWLDTTHSGILLLMLRGTALYSYMYRSCALSVW